MFPCPWSFGSSRSSAGLRGRDAVVASNGRPVAGVDDLRKILGTPGIGVKSTLTVLRGGRKLNLEIGPDDRWVKD